MLNGPLYYLTNITNSVFPRNKDGPENRRHLDNMVVVLMVLDLTDFEDKE